MSGNCRSRATSPVFRVKDRSIARSRSARAWWSIIVILVPVLVAVCALDRSDPTDYANGAERRWRGLTGWWSIYIYSRRQVGSCGPILDRTGRAGGRRHRGKGRLCDRRSDAAWTADGALVPRPPANAVIDAEPIFTSEIFTRAVSTRSTDHLTIHYVARN